MKLARLYFAAIVLAAALPAATPANQTGSTDATEPPSICSSGKPGAR